MTVRVKGEVASGQQSTVYLAAHNPAGYCIIPLMNMNRYRFLQTLESIGALLIVVGLIAAVAGLFTYRTSRTTAGWPSVEGTVTSAEVVEVERRGRAITFIDSPRITYSYWVDGELFFNDVVVLGRLPDRADSEPGRRILATYLVGTPVRVYYDPDEPQNSFLERELHNWPLRSGAILIGLGVAVLALRWLLRKMPYGREV
jgi:hypothetical protein